MKIGWIWANLIGLLGLSFVFPGAMLSPGPVIAAHAGVANDCLACHAPLRGVASERCVACHALSDIGVHTTGGAPVERRGRPAIGASFHQELTEQTCVSCHSDHGRLMARRFSHELLRPAVRGACVKCHAAPTDDRHRDFPATCSQCHTTEHWTPATFAHSSLSSATLARCESCHAPPADDLHRQFQGGCAKCHVTEHWSPATFEHDRFFVLDRHHAAPCATCHVGGDFKRYTCFGCHEHTPANIRAEHEEEGIRDLDNCVRCHRSADGEGGEGGEGRERE